MAGVSTVFRKLRPNVELIGCQSSGSPSMIESVRKGKAVSLGKADTFADGIAVMEASEKLRKILAPQIDTWVAADDEAIAAAVLTLLEKAKIVAEGAGALPLAVAEKIKRRLKGRKVVMILSGGNIDVNLLSRIIDRGLIRAGRKVRLNVWMSDRPGSLARLTELIPKNGGSIVRQSTIEVNRRL